MTEFLTSEHHAELADILTRAHSQGAQESDLATIRDHYLQNAALTDRNFREMHKPTDAPAYTGSVTGKVMSFLNRIADIPRGEIKNARENPGRTALEAVVPPLGAQRRAFEMAKTMAQQTGKFGGRALDSSADPASRGVAATQAALSLVPGISQAVPLGEELKNTGNTDVLGAGLADIAMTAGPEFAPAIGRAVTRGGNAAMESLFAPKDALDSRLVSEVAPQLATEGFTAATTEGARNSLLKRQVGAEDAAQAAIDAAAAAQAKVPPQPRGPKGGFSPRSASSQAKLQVAREAEIAKEAAVAREGGAQSINEIPLASPGNSTAAAGRTAAGAAAGFVGAGPGGAAAGAALGALYDVLRSPAAKTISAVAMNRIGQLMERGQVAEALALANAATNHPTPNPTPLYRRPAS